MTIKHSFGNRYQPDQFHAEIDENEIGPLLFSYGTDVVGIGSHVKNFNLQPIENIDHSQQRVLFVPLQGPNVYKEENSVRKFLDNLTFNPTSLGASTSKTKNFHPAESTLSMSVMSYNKEPIDFDSLNATAIIDPRTGIASKTLQFNVI